MFVLSLNEIMDQLAMANSVRWHDHVLRSDDDHVLWRALDCEVERKKGRPWRTWKKQVEKGRCTLLINVEFLH